MTAFVSRRRYELLALSVALFCVVLLAWSDRQPASMSEASGRSGVLLRGIQLLESRATNLKFIARGHRDPHPDVVVVAIDEKGAQRYGLWPWSRSHIAQAIGNLNRAGAKAIALDITFTDEAREGDWAAYRELLSRFDQALESAGPEVVSRLAELRGQLVKNSSSRPDLELAEVLAGAPQVVQGIFAYGKAQLADFDLGKVKEQSELLEPHLIRTAPGSLGASYFELPIDSLRAYETYSAQMPLPLFARTRTRVGHMNIVPDADGTLRRTLMVVKMTGPKGVIPSLGLQAAAVYHGAQVELGYQPQIDREVLTSVRIPRKDREPIVVPLQANEPFTAINYVGPNSVFKTLSIADVIDGRFDQADVRGKVALVGSTLTGNSGDQRVTPFKDLEPGIYTHASVVSMILSEDFLVRHELTFVVEGVAMLAVAFVLARLIPRSRSFGLKGAVILGAVALWAAVDLTLFARGIQLATVLPAANVLGVSFGLIFLGYLSVDREKIKLRSTFTRYLGEDVMEEALQNPDKLNRGEKREMTVLFSDIRGFTTLSERMVPEKLAAFIKEYLTPMTQIVFDEKGTLDKYIGDAVMAFWNAPLDQADHALRACRASLRFLEKLEELKKKWRSESYPEFDIGVGINSGPMIVGNMGSDVRVDYTVMGDAVNLASRLEGTNKEYETRIILSEATYQLVMGQVIARRLGAVRVKGKRKPVCIYELRGLGKPEGKQAEAIRLFETALDAYTEQRFDDAARGFQQTIEIWPADPPCRRYLDEITVLKVQPPGPGWDGVYTATTK